MPCLIGGGDTRYFSYTFDITAIDTDEHAYTIHIVRPVSSIFSIADRYFSIEESA
jgi:hypothetical protein